MRTKKIPIYLFLSLSFVSQMANALYANHIGEIYADEVRRDMLCKKTSYCTASRLKYYRDPEGILNKQQNPHAYEYPLLDASNINLEEGVKQDIEESTQKQALEQLQNIEDFDPSWLQRRTPDKEFPTNADAELALKAQVDIRTAQEDPEFATQRALELENDRKQLSPPVSSAIVNDPMVTGVLRPDFDKLDRLYQYLNQKEYLAGDRKDSFVEKVTTAYRKGRAIADDAYLSHEVRNMLSAGMPITGELKAKLDQSEFVLMAGISDGSFLSDMAVAMTEVLPPMVESLYYSGITAIEGAAVGSVLGSAVPGAGTLFGAGTGAIIGASIGFGYSTFNQTYVPTAYSYSKMKVEGDFIDPKIANTAATRVAVISTSLDFILMVLLLLLIRHSKQWRVLSQKPKIAYYLR